MTESEELWKCIEIGVKAALGALSAPVDEHHIRRVLCPQLFTAFTPMFQEQGITRDEAIAGIRQIAEKVLAG